MVNEEITNYGKEEINLAYEEMERRGLLPTDEPQAAVSRFAYLIGLGFVILEGFILHSEPELLPYPRAIALAFFVSMIAGYWHKPKPNTAFWKWVLWATSIVLLGLLALWEIPSLLLKQVPIMLAFGLPSLIYSLALFWFPKPNRTRKSKITTWLIGCIIFTILYSWFMSSGGYQHLAGR
jgi:hypothetical protein